MKIIKYIIFSVIILINTSKVFSQNYYWSALGSGVNGNINSITIFNGNIIAAGGFTQAGGISSLNIAQWNGTNWSPLGNGLNDTVYSLCVYNNKLYAGGKFTLSGPTPLSRIAEWNGTSWSSLGSGLDDGVYSLTVYNNALIAGGEFNNAGGTNAKSIAKWNGVSWSALGSGFSGEDNAVLAITTLNTDLIAAGKFNNAGGNFASNIAKWNGSSWSSFGPGITDDKIYALTVYNSQLYAGGKFNTIAGVSANHVARWTGSSWLPFGSGVSDDVYSLATMNNELIVAGNFKYSGSTTYVDRIVKWNGTTWSRMITGMNKKVKSLFIFNNVLYSGGEFTTAGGIYANRIGTWSSQTTHTVSGQVKYSDNNQPVLTGKVKAIRADVNTRELIIVDSAIITNGTFILPRVIQDTLHVIIFPDDELDFVPTYYPSNTDWQNSVKIFPTINLTDINVSVYRITQSTGSTNAGGHVYLNFLPSYNNPLSGFPYKSDAIVYAKQGNLFRKFSVSTTDEHYTITNLSPGTYSFYVNRIGYTNATQTVIIGGVSIDTVDFLLDTLNNPIGIEPGGTIIPKEYALYQNYPNPFNPKSKIRYSVPSGKYQIPPNVKGEISNVKLAIYDILGREIEILVNQHQLPGTYEIDWDGTNYPSSVYFYKLTAGEYTETKKMILIK
jgi:hypothetical protein